MSINQSVSLIPALSYRTDGSQCEEKKGYCKKWEVMFTRDQKEREPCVYNWPNVCLRQQCVGSQSDSR